MKCRKEEKEARQILKVCRGRKATWVTALPSAYQPLTETLGVDWCFPGSRAKGFGGCEAQPAVDVSLKKPISVKIMRLVSGFVGPCGLQLVGNWG